MSTFELSEKLTVVQAIRSYKGEDLCQAAISLGHHFLYTNLLMASSFEDVLETVTKQFLLWEQASKNLESLRLSLTESAYKLGNQPGFVVVIDNVPEHEHFTSQDREEFLEAFRDVAYYWAEKNIAFRCFYSFSVATIIQNTPSAREYHQGLDSQANHFSHFTETSPGKKIDLSANVLRMSSLFNPAYWLMSEKKKKK